VGGNKVIAVVVLAIVILGAIVIIVRQQGSSSDVPEWVKEQPVKLITSKQPYEVKTYKQGQIMDIKPDLATGYRMVDGQLMASPQTCASCQKQIPTKPHKIVTEPPGDPGTEPPPEEGPAFESYTCPLCGKEANVDPEKEVVPPPAR